MLWFGGLSLAFAALVVGCNYVAYVWAMRAGDPRIKLWFLAPDYKYLVDSFVAAVAFIVLRIPLWNLATSAPEARELATKSRRRLGEWLIGKDVLEHERTMLRRDVEGYWKREIELRARREVEDYARRNPPCPNPAAHRAPPPVASAEPARKLKKRDLKT